MTREALVQMAAAVRGLSGRMQSLEASSARGLASLAARVDGMDRRARTWQAIGAAVGAGAATVLVKLLGG